MYSSPALAHYCKHDFWKQFLQVSFRIVHRAVCDVSLIPSIISTNCHFKVYFNFRKKKTSVRAKSGEQLSLIHIYYKFSYMNKHLKIINKKTIFICMKAVWLLMIKSRLKRKAIKAHAHTRNGVCDYCDTWLVIS